MPKKGMARPDWTKQHPKNDLPPVPEIQGKAKHGHNKAHVVIGGDLSGPHLKVFHMPGDPYEEKDPNP